MFFTVRGMADDTLHLEHPLVMAWCVITAGYVEDGANYNLKAIDELTERAAVDAAREPQLLEIGWAGGMGPDQAHSAHAHG